MEKKNGKEKTGFCDYYGRYVNRVEKPCGKDANCLVCCAYQTMGEKRFLDNELSSRTGVTD